MNVITNEKLEFIASQILQAARDKGAQEPVFADSSDPSQICVVDEASGECYDITIKARKF